MGFGGLKMENIQPIDSEVNIRYTWTDGRQLEKKLNEQKLKNKLIKIYINYLQ